MIKYSIVIPTYQHCDDLLKPCLESIKKYTDLSDVEVLVVANGCTDNTKEYVESLGESFKLVWFDEAIGYTKATNEGIKASKGSYCVLLNNDTVLLDQEKNMWLKMLEEPFLKDPKTGITGPMLVHCPYANRQFLIFFCAMIKRELLEELAYYEEIKDEELVCQKE